MKKISLFTTIFSTALLLLTATFIPLPQAAASQPALQNPRAAAGPEKQNTIPSPVHPVHAAASMSEVAALFVVKTQPKSKALPIMQTEASPEIPEPVPEQHLPPLPKVRFLGEAVINGEPVIFCMAGTPERLLRLPDSEEEFILTRNSTESLTIEYNGRSIHVPK